MVSKRLNILAVLLLGAEVVLAAEGQTAQTAETVALYLKGKEVLSHQASTGDHVLVFEGAFSMSAGGNRFAADKAVVWVKAGPDGPAGRSSYEVRAYLEGRVSTKGSRRAEAIDLSRTVLKKGKSMVVRLGVGGVFVTADKRQGADPQGSELYKRASAAVSQAGAEGAAERRSKGPGQAGGRPAKEESGKSQVKSRYPITLSPVGTAGLKVEQTRDANGTYVVTIIGRFYMAQRQQKGTLLELQFDNAVIWYSEAAWKAYEQSRGEDKGTDVLDFLASGAVPAIYMSGDVVMTEGQRTIRAQEIYYNFDEQKGLVVNAEMRSFDVKRGIPIYVRASKLRQSAENRFEVEDFTVTLSEFHKPQISLKASSGSITDTTPVDQRDGKVSDSSYDAQMHDAQLKLGDATVFYWPHIRSNLERPDLPIKSVHVGYDSDWGTLVETRWYLSRLLGKREPEGVESTFMLDYYSERGVGSGVETEYTSEDSYGRLLGYMINDRGEDDLGRADSRRNLEPPRELRGRAQWQHRQFLPYNWQLSAEVGYLSDENFLESYYRREFNVGKEQETLVHLKRSEDNWGLSILGKARINDFTDEVEEVPGVEYHLTGQSLFDDRFTFYSDTQVNRFRNRSGSDSAAVSEKYFTFVSQRAELDMPMSVGAVKIVPFVAGTGGYEDGSGFYTNLEGGTEPREDKIWIGEAGVRASTRFWKVYPSVRSRLWDLSQLRHIIKPYFTAVGFAESDSVAEQRDTLSIGISQRLQTKRGPADDRRTVDWMRLDTDITWVNNSGDASSGPDRFLWNRPYIPLVDNYSEAMPPQDRRSTDIFGPRRNYLGGDYIWRVSDTTAILSDMNFDIQSGVVQQFNVGFSRLLWPDLSYYLGSRYLRRVENGLGEEGSNVFTFAATYVLDPRYTVIFSQQYDFDYGAGIRSDITLIRRYHRVYWGITYSSDESLKQQAIGFSIWPQGVPELAIGPRRYMRLGDSSNY